MLGFRHFYKKSLKSIRNTSMSLLQSILGFTFDNVIYFLSSGSPFLKEETYTKSINPVSVTRTRMHSQLVLARV